MKEIYLHNGDLLNVIKYNTSKSIQGISDPHVIALSNFLFLDHDFTSFSKLFNFYKSDASNSIDELPFYFGLSYLALSTKLDGELDHLDLEKEFKSLKFSNPSYKSILKLVTKFINDTSSKTLNKINTYDVDESIKLLASSFCFKYSNCNYEEYLLLFPFLNNVFIRNNQNTIDIQSKKNFLELLNDQGLFLIFFINKFYDEFNKDTINFILLNMFNKNIFDAFILHKYMSSFFHDKDTINLILNLLNDYKSFIDEKVFFGISHYIHLFNYENLEFDNTISWYNQIHSKLKDGQLKTDFDNFIDWNLDDFSFKPVNYSSYQKNSRFYLNSFPALIESRKKLSADNFSKGKKINAIGGLQALSWNGINNIDLSFHYIDRYRPDKNLFDLNNKDICFLNQNGSSNIIIFDIEMFLGTNIKKSLDAILFSIISKDFPSDIVFVTIPNPSLLSHIHFNSDDLNTNINLFNSYLLELCSQYKFKLIDIHKYLDIDLSSNFSTNNFSKALDYTDNSNLLSNYFIKPDIIKKIIKDELGL